ncbi:lipase [Neiella marina]|uniref:Lipase n=1 Tax=Neiella holothuriorum TaxID=2870530 RepID=A0ABS7ED28_9GAMM|nr:VolA/Pla-1 family phospholipase [Neiella holothuriorum]MBW8190225.1 lipase [Neiella holothuriorum]
MKITNYTAAPLLLALLAGCGGGESLKDIANDQEPAVPYTRIVFDPANSEISLPSDILLLTTTDGTLDIPVDDPMDLTDPAVALSSLDGWGTSAPIVIEMDYPQASFGDYSLSVESAAQVGAAELFEVILGSPLSSDPDCVTVSTGHLCKVVSQLTYGVDFITQSDGTDFVVVPIKPLKPKTSYLLATTTLLEDSEGRSVLPSSSYELLRLDVETQPLGSESQLLLQAAVNSYEAGLAEAGVDLDTVNYSMPFTTQSVVDVMSISRLVVANSQPTLSNITDTGLNAAEMLALSGVVLEGQAALIASAANVYSATVNLVMFQDIASTDNCDLTELVTTGVCDVLFTYWQAQGDSPVSIAGALADGSLTQESFAIQAMTQNPALTPEDLADPSKWVGLQINVPDASGTPVDSEKHLTQYNPLGLVKGLQQVPVLITVPDTTTVNAIRASLAGIDMSLLPAELTLTEPAAGWPVAVFAHGITSLKESVLGLAGTMALQGQATIALDLPMHGARSADLTGNGVYELTATAPSNGAAYANGNVLTYLNLSSLMSVRDAMRQSALDILTLRAAITFTALQDAAMMQAPLLDASHVGFVGMSQGAIVGTSAVTVANTPFVVDGVEMANPFAFNSAVLNVPTGGYGPSVAFSTTFAPVLKDGLTASDTFSEALQTAFSLTAEELEAIAENDPEQYQAMVDAVYPTVLNEFLFAAQQVLDSADSINFASTLSALETPVLLHEVVGNGAENLSDHVLPNSTAANGWPVAGTEALIGALSLPAISSSQADSDGIMGAVRFMYGFHSSLLSPAAVEGIAPDAAKNAVVTATMQQQAAEFISTAGQQLTISEESAAVIVPAS